VKRVLLWLVLVASLVACGGPINAGGAAPTPTYDNRGYCTGAIGATLAPNCKYGPLPT
jgi:hypothetical protein